MWATTNVNFELPSVNPLLYGVLASMLAYSLVEVGENEGIESSGFNCLK